MKYSAVPPVEMHFGEGSEVRTLRARFSDHLSLKKDCPALFRGKPSDDEVIEQLPRAIFHLTAHERQEGDAPESFAERMDVAQARYYMENVMVAIYGESARKALEKAKEEDRPIEEVAKEESTTSDSKPSLSLVSESDPTTSGS